jgi:hypothetical protein
MATTTTVDDSLAASLKALALAGQSSPTTLQGDTALSTAGPMPPAPGVPGAAADSLRPELGQRMPPQYSQALAALQRAIY